METKSQIRQKLQKLIDQSTDLHGNIAQIDQEIVEYENSLLGTGWSEGNIKVGWTKSDIFSDPISTTLMSRDRIFSLSSITSRASTHLTPIQNQKTAPSDGSRFYKKKKKNIKKNMQDQSYIEREKVNGRKERYPKRK